MGPLPPVDEEDFARRWEAMLDRVGPGREVIRPGLSLSYRFVTAPIGALGMSGFVSLEDWRRGMPEWVMLDSWMADQAIDYILHEQDHIRGIVTGDLD